MYCKAIKYGAIPIFNIIQYPVTEYSAGPFRPVTDTRPLQFWYIDNFLSETRKMKILNIRVDPIGQINGHFIFGIFIPLLSGFKQK